jgi:hypothetical protein
MNMVGLSDGLKWPGIDADKKKAVDESLLLWPTALLLQMMIQRR